MTHTRPSLRKSANLKAGKPQGSLGNEMPRAQAVLNSAVVGQTFLGVSQIRGTLFKGPDNKEYSIIGSILGSPSFGQLPLINTSNIWSASASVIC